MQDTFPDVYFQRICGANGQTLFSVATGVCVRDDQKLKTCLKKVMRKMSVANI